MKAKILIIILLLIFIMTGIVHERIVASRDKGLAEDWNANHQITGNVDMGQYSWLNQVIENRVDFPAGPVEGQIVYRSDLNQFYVYNGATWDPLFYTDAEARAAINNIFGADGKADADIDIDGHDINNVVVIRSPTNETMLISASGVATLLSLYGSSGITLNVDPGETIDFLDPISMSAHKITNLADGAAATDAAAFGQIGIVSGTHYWSCAGNHFKGSNPDTDALYEDPDEGVLNMEANGIFTTACVDLPDGAVVTAAIVYGSPTDETWYLRRLDMTNPGFAISMATANIGTQDATINNATIDNSDYAYFFETGSLDTNDIIYGARIRYTL